MQSKSLLIAVAAFAVTASGVHAFSGPSVMQRAGLNKEQAEAMGEARELRASGDLTAARDRLVEAGINEDTLMAIRRAAKEDYQHRHKEGKPSSARHEHTLDDFTEEQKDALRFAQSNNDRNIVQAILDEAGVEFHPQRTKKQL